MRTLVIKQIVGGIAGFFGGSSGGGSVGGTIGSTFSSFASGFSFLPKAGGGRVSLNSAYIVGERGPELFSPDSNGTIVPNNQLFGQPNVNIAFNVENQTGQKIAMEPKNVKFDTDRIIVDAVMRNIDSRGPLYHALQRR